MIEKYLDIYKRLDAIIDELHVLADEITEDELPESTSVIIFVSKPGKDDDTYTGSETVFGHSDMIINGLVSMFKNSGNEHILNIATAIVNQK